MIFSLHFPPGISQVIPGTITSRRGERQADLRLRQPPVDCCTNNMGNCCKRLLYRLTKKPKTEDDTTNSSNKEDWGDWEDVEAPTEPNRTSVRLSATSNHHHHHQQQQQQQQQESVPFIHPNTIKSSTPVSTSPQKFLKAKSGWVVKEKVKKKTNHGAGRLEGSVRGFNETRNDNDPFSSLGMTANYTDDRKIQPKKKSTSAKLGGGARSLEEDLYEDEGGWDEAEGEDDI